MEAAATKAGQDPSLIDSDRPISVQAFLHEAVLPTRVGDVHEIELLGDERGSVLTVQDRRLPREIPSMPDGVTLFLRIEGGTGIGRQRAGMTPSIATR